MKKTVVQLVPGVDIVQGGDAPHRIALLLWGNAGCGKTTFAATAPGKKLWLSFGDQEHVAVMHRKDVVVANLSELGFAELFKHGQNDNPFGLDQILANDTEIETVVVDSSTALAFRALQKAVSMRLGASRDFTPTMEAPGLSAYGGRNAIVLEVLTGLLRVTAKHGVHLIITAHEGEPVKEEKTGTVLFITLVLGGQLVSHNAWRLSEVWWLSEEVSAGVSKGRKIAVRPTRLRKPMKTRMFRANGAAEFVLDYDAEKPDKGQMTLASLYEKWKAHGKMEVPGGKK